MTKQEQLEKKVVNACADYALATYALDTEAAYAAAYAAFVDAEAAYVKAMDELKEYTQEVSDE